MGVIGTAKNAASSVKATVNKGQQKMDDVKTLFTADSEAQKAAEAEGAGAGWGTSADKVRSVEDIMEDTKRAEKEAKAKRKKAISNLMGGQEETASNDKSDKSNDKAEKSEGSKEEKSSKVSKFINPANMATAGVAVATGIMNGKSIGQAIKGGVDTIVAHAGAAAQGLYNFGSSAYQFMNGQNNNVSKTNVGLPSAEELKAQQKAIENFHAQGRDTKYLTLTQKQWDGLSELQKYNVASTIFVDQHLDGVQDFKTYAQAMTFGDLSTMVKSAAMKGERKELQDPRFMEDKQSTNDSISFSLSDEQMKTIDKNVEGENIFEAKENGEVQATADAYDAATAETELSADEIAANAAAAKQAEQSALIREGAPEIKETTLEEISAGLQV